MGIILPLENSIVTVVGTVVRVRENYAIRAEAWKLSTDSWKSM